MASSVATIAIVVTVVIVAVVIIAVGIKVYIVCYLGKLTSRKDPATGLPTIFKVQQGTTAIGTTVSNLVNGVLNNPPPQQKQPRVIAGLQRFTLQEVERITEKRRIKLGEGGFGPVYHGKLENGKQVAVKMLKKDSGQGEDEFLNELLVLSRVHHNNLVSLVGYCDQFNERILIYEYMPKGSLHDHLHGNDAVNEPLDWLARLRIAVNAANGLKYLHTDSTPSVIHRDIKSTNILLD